MDKHQRRSKLVGMILLGAPFVFGPAVYAAKPVDLAQQSVHTLQSFVGAPGLSQRGQSGMEEISRSSDFNQTLHVRVQQTYGGYRVWGADAVVHIPHGTNVGKTLADVVNAAKSRQGFMNGGVYDGLQADLAGAPENIFSDKQADKAIKHAESLYQKSFASHGELSDQRSELIVYVDGNQKAHWAYKVDFRVSADQEGKLPAMPNYILDATTFEVYQQWNNLQTADSTPCETCGGGVGGNKNMGKYFYDALSMPDHWNMLKITRDSKTNICSLKNPDVTVLSYKNNKVVTYNCEKTDSAHNDTYWVETLDPVNGGYSPSDDALFGGQVIKSMYQDWYGLPVLTENGKPMMLNMVVHEKIDNAYWDGRRMTFGDGVDMFYPLTSLGVASHEISHGFTEQHSNLSYYGQSGGMNEAFSDMAAQAAELFAYGKSSYQIGPEIMKQKGTALRYMDVPSKDCDGKRPGDWCSIDNASQYSSGLDVHFSSGVFNRAYYTLATTEGWDQRKAFDVMVKANMDYWTSSSTFEQGACGVIHAAKDHKYDTQAVINAFTTVGVKTSKCTA